MRANTLKEHPLFDRNFDDFLNYLNDNARPASISPKRFSQIMNLDTQTLATKARVHRNTITRAPDTESVQSYLRESIRVLCAATDIVGSVEKAIFWFKNNPLPAFDYKTPQDLVSEKRTDTLIRYIQSLQAGFTG
jgi:uncharacterized protein (DUF2384 family)